MSTRPALGGNSVDKLLSTTARKRAQVNNARETHRLKQTCHAVDRLKFASENGYRKEKEALQQTLVDLRSSVKTDGAIVTSLPDIQCKQKDTPTSHYAKKTLTRKSSAPEPLTAAADRSPGDITVQAKRKLSEPLSYSGARTPRRQRATVESDIDETLRKCVAREGIAQRRMSLPISGVAFMDSRLERSNSILSEWKLQKLTEAETKPSSPTKTTGIRTSRRQSLAGDQRFHTAKD